MAEETTEHVIACKEYQYNTQHSLDFRQRPEKMDDIKWLKEASVVYEHIEEAREWLL